MLNAPYALSWREGTKYVYPGPIQQLTLYGKEAKPDSLLGYQRGMVTTATVLDPFRRETVSPAPRKNHPTPLVLENE